jgi:hypothetical protein
VRGLKLVSAGMRGLHMDFDEAAEIFAHVPPWMASYAGELDAALAPGDPPPVPRMSIVIMVVGSRGDVQPFLPIGRRLAQRHRVRIATHHEFRSMVEEAELEFYPLGGDPHELINYMVKTGGRIIPTRIDHLVEDVPKKRAMIADILASTWRACTKADPEHPDAPFQADWIIANPPSYGHIHCAERLHIPLHMIFTMPWTPTSAFPHPMARLDPGVHRPVQNYMSYAVVDVLAWSGIGDLVNEFREQTLALPPISLSDGPSLLEDHEVPFTYLWPASLVPKPRDWGPHIDLANFIFYDRAHTISRRAVAGVPRRRRTTDLRRLRLGDRRRRGSDQPHDLRGGRKGRRARRGVRRVVASRWRSPAAERPFDRRRPPRLAVPALQRRVSSRWGGYDRCRPACGVAHRRGAVLRRSVLLGRGDCRRRRWTRSDSD